MLRISVYFLVNMARLTALFVPLFALFFLCVGSVPAAADLGGLSIGDIINALGVGLVKDINAIITVRISH